MAKKEKKEKKEKKSKKDKKEKKEKVEESEKPEGKKIINFLEYYCKITYYNQELFNKLSIS